MASIIPGYEYDIFISYRHKDNKHDGWVTDFVENLKGELESTFKEEVTVYFDINPHDGLLETHDVNASLREKLKCLVFIPIISRTYCDPNSYAWEHEFKAFVEQASHDQFGLKVKLSNGNVTSRILPVQIHDLHPEDKSALEKELGGVLRAIEFIYREPGVNKPLTADDDEKKNLTGTKYRIQINKVSNVIDEIINSLKGKQSAPEDRNLFSEQPSHDNVEQRKSMVQNGRKGINQKSAKWIAITFALLLVGIIGVFAINKIISGGNHVEDVSKMDKSIAVLPFTNDSPDKDNDYFCNGMMEEILNQLQKIGDLKVKARTSVEKYRNYEKDIQVIGNELGVSLIMEGSVRKIGNDLRISTQLIDARTGNHLWSEVYDGKYTTEIFEFQSNVAKKVAESLNAVITPQEEKRIDSRPTSDMVAYDLCSRGEARITDFRYTWDTLNLKVALNLFNDALKIDPDYIDAFAGKGRAYTEAGKYDSAMMMYNKIQELDPTGHISALGKGLVYMYSYNADSAFKYFRKALDLAPNNLWYNLALGQCFFYLRNNAGKGLSYYQNAYNLGGDLDPEINHQIAILYFNIGDYSKSLKYINKAIYLRPECELLMKYSYILFSQKNYAEALQYLDSICNINACEQRCDIMRFHIYTELKEFKKAEEYYTRAINSGYKRTAEDDLFIGYIYNETGRRKEAISLLGNYAELTENMFNNNSKDWKNITGLRLAAAYAIMGDNQRALNFMKYHQPNIEIIGVFFNPNTFPGFDNLRNNTEFKAILQRLENEKTANRNIIREMEERGEIRF